MAWGGVDAIPLLPGESRRQAVDRIYAGGTAIELVGDEMMIGTIAGHERDFRHVGRSQRAWMLQAAALLEELRPGWTVVDESRDPGRRWPWYQQLENPVGLMWVQLGNDCATFRYVRDPDVAVDRDAEWRFWWRTVRRFARLPAAIFHPDTSSWWRRASPVARPTSATTGSEVTTAAPARMRVRSSAATSRASF